MNLRNNTYFKGKLSTMKQILFSVIIVTTALGCGSSESTKPLTTEIPTELSANTDVQEYFETLDLFIDEYITMVEGLVKAGKEAEASEEDMGFMAAIDLVTSVASSAMTMAPLLEKLEELEKQGEVLQEEMTGEELEAFIETYSKMMARLIEVSSELDLLD